MAITIDKKNEKKYHFNKGGVAQLVRASGSYPLSQGFESLHRHHPSLRKFKNFLKEFPLQEGDRILLAYSGGGDSAGMLSLFLSLDKPKFNLGLCHINHRLRGKESDDDERFCRALAKSLKVPFYSYKVRSKFKKGDNLEEWARKERYKLLQRCRKVKGYDYIATAHTKDDQAETLLIRIERGCGLEGLIGINKVLNGEIIRPCLIFRSIELREIAKECKVPYIEDSSNRETKFLRNRIRIELLPQIEKVMPNFVDSLYNLSQIVDSCFKEIPVVAKKEGNSLYYPIGGVAGLSENDFITVIKKGIKEMVGDLRGFQKNHYIEIVKVLRANKGAILPLPRGLCVVKESEGLRILRKKIGAVR